MAPPAKLAGISHAISATAQAADIKLVLGAPQVVSTYEQRQKFGFQFGYTDGVMGSVADQESYLYFGSAKSDSDYCNSQGDTPQTQGVYRLAPDAEDPLRIHKVKCRALLRPSGIHPGVHPHGIMGPFDRDYLGGGPVMRVSDGQHSGILIVYHAEFQYGQPRSGKANLFFGTLGMAVSTDNGKTFQKLGQIIQPHPSRPEWIKEFSGTALSVGDGPFILGDDGAHPIDPLDPRNPDPERTYIYVFYIDYQAEQAEGNGPQCSRKQCLAVARAKLSEVMKAAFRHHIAGNLFKKYHNGEFKEPAATLDPQNFRRSGAYTPVLSQNFSPSIIYDPATRQAILATQAGPDGIEFRASSTLTHWPPTPLYTLNESIENFAVRYPSLILTTGKEGQPQLWLFYSHAPLENQTWAQTTLMARAITTAAP
jgi:hypothetical protein